MWIYIYCLFLCVVKVLYYYNTPTRNVMPEIETSVNQKGHVLLFCLGFVPKKPYLYYIYFTYAVRFKITPCLNTIEYLKMV